jgi:peptidoglycan/xylan/chitin deacetylase (PgdA/CDA1 family)
MEHKTIRLITHLLKPTSILNTHHSKKELNQRTILTYHGVSKRPQFNCVTESLFVDQISWLKENYSVVSLFELVKSLKSSVTNQSNLVSITFDDGYINFAEFAIPILEKYACHATVFVPSGKVGHYNDWDERQRDFHKMPIMSYEQLRQLPEKVVEIGSHGISHIPLDQLLFDGVTREIIESRLEIEQNVGRLVQFFAFPFGRYLNSYRNNKNLIVSYNAACTSWWGRYNSPKDIYTLRRIGIWESDSFEDFVDKLEGYYDWLAAKEKINRFYKFITSLPRL